MAQAAEKLSAFGGLNLLHIKRELANLLGHIGQESIFAEYTRHDLQHVDAMLNMLDWIVPTNSKKNMTTADWLMIVLASYFHDLGMLVTRDEYQSRYKSGFRQYRDSKLLTDDQLGKDYAHKVDELGEETAERFLYQEYVREHHASRIRTWLTNPQSCLLGKSELTAQAIVDLLAPLGETFTDDLGIVCESHHLDDLDDVQKYKPRRRYGSSESEVANLQYSAVLLRTVDLLHVTRDRTPSISFRVQNPADPKSREEWEKQMTVVAVAPKIGQDRDQNYNESLPRDTIEVHARFTSADGFFALTGYLQYASMQLNQNHIWIEESRKRLAVKHEFPWREIDQSNIETKGFLSSQFKFTLDQYKILELLTGHTLYNDTNVVLREVVQNAIDAVRLQYADPTGKRTLGAGEVHVHWSSGDRILTVTDDGTGMSQQIIEENFLKVGSSLYQDSKFKDRYPDFSPISMFGIGVLSTFMIADRVEVITCHPDDSQARLLSLRNVHGKYLVRLLDKDSPTVPTLIRNQGHGTCVRLKVRATADIGNVGAVLRRWFVLPGCNLTVQVDNNPRSRVGAESLAETLRQQLAQIPHLASSIDVREYLSDGVEVAYAVRWSQYFKEWSLFTPDPSMQLGTCVEGVRVEAYTPGYDGLPIAAIANASGPRAPRTNVARSAIEDTLEYRETLRIIYRSYGEHIRKEVQNLHDVHGYSRSWAANEAAILASALIRDSTLTGGTRMRPKSKELMTAEIRRIPFYVVDDGTDRRNCALEELRQFSHLYSVDNPLMRHTQRLLRELPGDVSVSKVLEVIGGPVLNLPDGPLIDMEWTHNYVTEQFLAEWEVTKLSALSAEGKLDVRWSPYVEPPRWRRVDDRTEHHPLYYRIRSAMQEIDIRSAIQQTDGSYVHNRYSRHSQSASFEFVLPVLSSAGELEIDGLAGYTAVILQRSSYLLPDRPWQKLLLQILDETKMKRRRIASRVLFFRLSGY